MAKNKKQKRQFVKLSNVEHVRLRTGMWLGQNSYSTYEQHYFLFDKRSKRFNITHYEIEEIPAKMKCLDEACMNSIDEYRRNQMDKSLQPRKKMNRLTVALSSDQKRISVEDNGRGIPAKNAEGVFLHLMYGENFDDKLRKEHLAGQNGVGISLVRIVSSYFRVQTSCGGKTYTKLFTINQAFLDQLKIMRINKEDVKTVVKHFDEHSTVEGCSVLSAAQNKKLLALMKKNYLLPSVRKSEASRHGTKVEFQLEPEYFNDLDLRYDPELVEQYLLEIAFTNPGLEVVFEHKNKSRVYQFKKGLDDLFQSTDLSYYKLSYNASDAKSKLDLNAYVIMGEGKNLTWVNSNFASLGGSSIEYLENRICDEVRKKPSITALEKKLKTPSTRNDVRNCFHIIVNMKVLNPRFKSQDKSYLINDLNAEIREAVDKNLDKLLRKTTLVEDIKGQMQRRTHLKAVEEAAKSVRRAKKINIPKLIPPTGDVKANGRVLFVGEGDSAVAGLRPVRTPELHGLFPLRGKPLNVHGMSLPKVLANEELKNIVAIIGLPLDRKVKSIRELNYSKVSIITDADFDGYAIRSLMLSFFYRFWPELFELGFIHISNAPLYEVVVKEKAGNKQYFCIDDADYECLLAKVKKQGASIVRKKRNKGLGETGKEAMRFTVEHCMTRITVKQKTTASKIQKLWFAKDLAEQRRRVIAEYSMRFYEE